MLVAFDIETDRAPETFERNPRLGISCAALLDENGDLTFYTSPPGRRAMTKEQCSKLVDDMLAHVSLGDKFVTVNGVGFDFRILSECSGRVEEVADIALNHHHDLMLYPVCVKGWRVGVAAFAKAQGVEGKLKSVRLNDGTVMEGMSGAVAPELWGMGERDAVLAYLREDVRTTLEIAQRVTATSRLRWNSRNGRGHEIRIHRQMKTAAELLALPEPDRSWMDSPFKNEEIYSWTGAVIG